MPNKPMEHKIQVDRDRFYRIIRNKGLSVRQLGKEANRTEKTIRRYLDQGSMTYDLVCSISEAIGVPAEHFAKDTNVFSINRTVASLEEDFEMKKNDYLDKLVNELNSLNLTFRDIPVVFDQRIVQNGVKMIGSEREQLVFSMRCNGWTYNKIGKELGVTGSRVKQILDKLRRKLRGLWIRYYTITLADADIIIRNEVNRNMVEYIREYGPNEDIGHKGYRITDFAINADLSVRTYNCIRRAGIDTVEELIQCTPNEVITWRNFGRRSYEELVTALSQIGLSLREE